VQRLIQKNTPIRKCIACGSRKPKSEFAVIVRPPKSQQNEMIQILDGSEKKEGRGAYICKNADCLKKARKSRRLENIFKKKMDDRVYDMLEKAVTGHE
jgi:predicted RNA-binding protein YlxR (DUF448 family)